MIIRFTLILVAAAALYGLVHLSSLEPSHNRDWLDYYDKTYDADVNEDSTVTLRHVRDWNHDDTGAISQNWLENEKIDADEVSRVWFMLATIGDSKYVAHSFLVFEMDDGRAYSFSIEARREEGEPYSPILGLFRKYELAYTWGMERDFVGVRLFFLDYQTEIYPLELSKKEAGGVFLAMARATADVAEHPRFYNTLTGNCTNLLVEAINAAVPGRLPYDPAWNLPALSVGYLIEQGLIDPKGESVEVVREKAVINDYTDELSSNSNSAKEFSDTLRRLYFEGN